MTDDKKFRIDQEMIGLGRAKALLASNTERNRNIRVNRVEGYARDMLAGQWMITGETVKLDPEGVMIDGQHRMSAVVMAASVRPDIKVPMLVAYNVSPEAMPVLDTNIPRGLHDVVGILTGAKNAHLMAAVARRVLQWEQGNYMGASGRNGGVPTHTEAMLRINKDLEGFAAASARGRDMQLARVAPGAPSGTAFYLFRQIDPALTHVFFDFLVGGENLTGPILTLRNRLIRADRLRAHEYLALFVRTWNAWREGRDLGQVLVDTSAGKLSNSNFPKPK